MFIDIIDPSTFIFPSMLYKMLKMVIPIIRPYVSIFLFNYLKNA